MIKLKIFVTLWPGIKHRRKNKCSLSNPTCKTVPGNISNNKYRFVNIIRRNYGIEELSLVHLHLFFNGEFFTFQVFDLVVAETFVIG